MRALATWLSPADCVRMVAAALVAPSPGFALIYGISANSRAWWDLEPGRAVGYEPQDDAEDYAADVPPDAAEGMVADPGYLGGAFAVGPLHRPFE